MNWSNYAQVYDRMAENNFAYQELLQRFRQTIRSWVIAPGAHLVEIGGGTGNYSLEMAAQFQECQVYHCEPDAAMNRRATWKAAARGLCNVEIQPVSADVVSFQLGSVAAVVIVHALYAIPAHDRLIMRAFEWLIPGGHLFVCDLGRVLDIGDWRTALLDDLRRRKGILWALLTFWRCRAVARHNRTIARLQREGRYWTHTLDDFSEVFVKAGFVIEQADTCYRGYSDLVICRRPWA